MNTYRCPKCNHKTLICSMREDYCTNYNYNEHYENAYTDSDPGGDFENSEEYL